MKTKESCSCLSTCNNCASLLRSDDKTNKYQGLEVPLPFEERELLREALASKVIPNPIDNNLDTLSHIIRGSQRCYQFLPEYMHRQLLQMRLGTFNPSYYLVRGLPIDEDLPATPLDGSWNPNKKTFISEALLLGIGSMLGFPFGFAKEKDGRLVNQISPIPGKEETQSSASATTLLGYHTEIAYEDNLRPRFLLLVCLRQDREKTARTNIVDMRNVLRNLPNWAIQELRKHQFQFKVPDSFSNSTIWAAPKPILSGPLSNPEVVYDAKACKLIYHTETGSLALKLLQVEVNKPEYCQAIELTLGDLLIIPNYFTVHGRSSFVPRFDGHDRWLVRVYVTDSIFKNRQDMTENLLVFGK